MQPLVQFALRVQNRLASDSLFGRRARSFARGIERCELSRDLDIELAIDIISGFSTYRFLLGLPVDAVMIRQMVGTLLKGLRLPVNGRVDGRTSTRELSP